MKLPFTRNALKKFWQRHFLPAPLSLSLYLRAYLPSVCLPVLQYTTLSRSATLYLSVTLSISAHSHALHSSPPRAVCAVTYKRNTD